jgi:hypothetical protein
MSRPLGPYSRWLWRAAALLVLALVFSTYLQPDMVFDLANRIWSCF